MIFRIGTQDGMRFAYGNGEEWDEFRNWLDTRDLAFRCRGGREHHEWEFFQLADPNDEVCLTTRWSRRFTNKPFPYGTRDWWEDDWWLSEYLIAGFDDAFDEENDWMWRDTWR